jgi:hypothetical protein
MSSARHQAVSCPRTSNGKSPGAQGVALKLPVWTALAAFLASRAYLLLELQPRISDIHYYWTRTVLYLVEGRMPYRDFPVDYPPLAWWAICLPRLVPNPFAWTYATRFRCEMFLCDVFAFLLLHAIMQRRRPQATGWVCLGYALTTAVLGHILYDRLDVGLTLFLLAWAYCWVRSLDDSSPRRWTLLAYLALGLSIGYKFIPVLIAPFGLLTELRGEQRWKHTAQAAVVLAGATLFPFLISLPWTGPNVFGFMSGHVARGLQIETLYASVVLVGHFFGLPASTEGVGTVDVRSAWSPALIAISSVAPVIYVALCGLWALFRGTAFDRVAAYRLSCLVLATAVILAKVLSPQYFIWSIVMLLLAAVDLPTQKPWTIPGLVVLLIVVAGMTTWVFPLHYTDDAIWGPNGEVIVIPDDLALTKLAASTCLVLVGRNLLYLALVVKISWDFFRSDPALRTELTPATP